MAMDDLFQAIRADLGNSNYDLIKGGINKALFK